jgi:hypothetical protein
MHLILVCTFFVIGTSFFKASCSLTSDKEHVSRRTWPFTLYIFPGKVESSEFAGGSLVNLSRGYIRYEETHPRKIKSSGNLHESLI